MDAASTGFAIIGNVGSLFLTDGWALTLWTKQGVIFLFGGLLYVLSWAYAAIAWPVFTLYTAVAILLSPIVYPILYALAPIAFLIRLIPSLEPLYIFLGSAAFVGSLLGATLLLTLRPIETFLLPAASPSRRRLTQGRRMGAIEGAPPSPLDSIEDDMSSLDDWAWMEKFKTMKTEPVLTPVLTPAPSKRRHHHSDPPGLIATILEESSAE